MCWKLNSEDRSKFKSRLYYVTVGNHLFLLCFFSFLVSNNITYVIYNNDGDNDSNFLMDIYLHP